MGGNAADIVSGGIAASHDQVSSDIASISVEVVGNSGDSSGHSGFPAGVESQELEFSLAFLSHLIAVGSGTSSGAVDVGSHMVQFCAVLLGDQGSSTGPGISGEHDAIGADHSHNGGSCLLEIVGFGSSALEDVLISLVVGEVESFLLVGSVE